MNQDIINPNIDNAIQRAERAVENSIDKFEAAMGHLADKAEMTSQKLQHVREVGKKSKDQLVHLKDEVSTTLEPMRPYVSRARTFSRDLASGIRPNSRPLLLGALGLVGGYFFYRYYLQGKMQSRSIGSSYSGTYTTGQSADQFSNLSYPR